jgi:hypothetical protein
MKTTSNTWPRLLAACLLPFLFLASLSAQEAPPKVGFIRLVNAVAPGTGPVNLKIDGEDVFPKGYKLGQRTGGIGRTAGSKKLTVTRDGTVEGTTTVSLGVGETVSLVAFAEKVPAKDDKPEQWEIRILRLKQRDVEGGFRFTVLSVSKEPETPFLTLREGSSAKATHSVKRLMTTTIDLGRSAGDISIYLRNQEEPLAFFRPDSPGNYVVVLYDDDKGETKAISFYDPKFVIAG